LLKWIAATYWLHVLSKYNRRLLGVFLFEFFAQAAPYVSDAQTRTIATGTSRAASPEERRAWHEYIAWMPVLSKGCLKAVYPQDKWTSIPCSATPVRSGSLPRENSIKVENGKKDFAAGQFATGVTSIGWADGSFAQANVTNEVGVSADGKEARLNEFSLQLNTNPFRSPLCNASANNACRGWEQFVLGNDPGSPPAQLFIRFWLLNFGSPCPKAWVPSGGDCVFTTVPTSVEPLSVQELAKVTLTGKVENNGTDTVILTGDGPDAFAYNTDSQLTLASNWNTVEFNVFGDPPDHEAAFGAGSTLVANVHVRLFRSLYNAIEPIMVSFTGKTNNLNLVMPACPVYIDGGLNFGVTFKESNVAHASFTCPDDPCVFAENQVAYTQKQLAAAQSAMTTQSCSGLAMSVCMQELKVIQHTSASVQIEKKQACAASGEHAHKYPEQSLRETDIQQ
jgi:hypothetical protein